MPRKCCWFKTLFLLPESTCAVAVSAIPILSISCNAAVLANFQARREGVDSEERALVVMNHCRIYSWAYFKRRYHREERKLSNLGSNIFALWPDQAFMIKRSLSSSSNASIMRQIPYFHKAFGPKRTRLKFSCWKRTAAWSQSFGITEKNHLMWLTLPWHLLFFSFFFFTRNFRHFPSKKKKFFWRWFDFFKKIRN